MRASPGLVAMLLLCGCPGNPIEATLESVGGDGSSSGGASSSSATASSVTQGDELGSDDGSGSTTSTTPTSASTSESSSDPTAEPSSGSDDASTTGTDPSAGTSEGSTTTAETAAVCDGDEASIHDDPSVAIQLPDIDCNTAVQMGAGVLDAATGVDWWWFYGTDSVGTCEPVSVRVAVTSGGPLPVCALVQPGCTASCTIGDPDGSGRGCCGTDTVQLVPDCGVDDNTSITFSFGLGTEACLPYTWEYEF